MSIQRQHQKLPSPPAMGNAITWPELIVSLLYAAGLIGAVFCLMGR